MKIVTLQRLSFLAALPLCMVLVMATARAAEPPAPSDVPASGHSPHGNDLVNIGRDSDLPRGESADSVVSIFGSSTCAGEATDVVSIFGDTRIPGEVSDGTVAVFGN